MISCLMKICLIWNKTLMMRMRSRIIHQMKTKMIKNIETFNFKRKEFQEINHMATLLRCRESRNGERGQAP